MRYKLTQDGYYRYGECISLIMTEKHTGEKYYYIYNELNKTVTFGSNIIDAICAVRKDMADKVLKVEHQNTFIYKPIRFVNREYGERVREAFLKECEELDMYYIVEETSSKEPRYLRSDMTFTYQLQGARRLRKECDAIDFIESLKDLNQNFSLQVIQVVLDRELIVSTKDIYKVANEKFNEIHSIPGVVAWLNVILDCGTASIISDNGLIYYYEQGRKHTLTRYCVENIHVRKEYKEEFVQYLNR